MACSETALRGPGVAPAARGGTAYTVRFSMIRFIANWCQNSLIPPLYSLAPATRQRGGCDTGKSARATWQPAEKNYHIGDTSLVSGGRLYDVVRHETSYPQGKESPARYGRPVIGRPLLVTRNRQPAGSLRGVVDNSGDRRPLGLTPLMGSDPRMPFGGRVTP